MTKPTIADLPRILRENTITQIYRGRVGCCCGCNGEHLTGDDLTTRRLARVKRDLMEATPEELKIDLYGEGGNISRERNGRYVIAYLNGE